MISNFGYKKIGADSHTVDQNKRKSASPQSLQNNIRYANNKSRRPLSISKQIVPRRPNQLISNSIDNISQGRRVSMSADYNSVGSTSNSENIKNRKLFELNNKSRGGLPPIEKQKILSHHAYLPSRFKENPYVQKFNLRDEPNELSQELTRKIMERSPATKFLTNLKAVKELKYSEKNKKLKINRL